MRWWQSLITFVVIMLTLTGCWMAIIDKIRGKS